MLPVVNMTKCGRTTGAGSAAAAAAAAGSDAVAARPMLLIMCVAAIVALARAAPNYSAVYVDDRAQNYLMKFGYLPQSGLETGNLRTDDQLRDAIRSLQKFGGIPETGVVDVRTQKLMGSRRCGLPDKPDLRLQELGLHGRYKRYTLHGTPWKHLNLTWRLIRKLR